MGIKIVEREMRKVFKDLDAIRQGDKETVKLCLRQQQLAVSAARQVNNEKRILVSALVNGVYDKVY